MGAGIRMYTVVVADDEEEIRRSLIRKVDWAAAGFLVAGEAENGIEALELVEKLEPDLLITDIKMPFISGIELARQVREIRPMTHIAFLSGYDDFSYAQQAIQYNIISYMLKPVTSEKMLQELTNIRQKIEDKYQVFVPQDQIQRKTEFMMALLLDRFQEDGTPDGEERLKSDAVSCGLLDGGGEEVLKYVVMVTQIRDDQNVNRTAKSSTTAIDSILCKYVKYSSIYVQGRVVSLLMATARGFDKYLHILVEDIEQSVKRVTGWNCAIGVSRSKDHLTKCHECYMEAMNALSYSKKNAGGVHFISDEERVEEIDQETQQKILADIESILRRGGTEEEMELYLEKIFLRSEYGKLNWTVKSFLMLQIASTALQVLYTVAGNGAVQNLQQKFPLNQVIATADSAQIFLMCRAICGDVLELIAEQRRRSGEILCEKALRIIEEQYMDPELSLVEVSREIAVSPNYLSALIKKNTGSTFKDLLTRKRIETARDMLLCTSMKIREITEKCGYKDQHYFSYCFKKYTGISPNQSRSIHEEQRA